MEDLCLDNGGRLGPFGKVQEKVLDKAEYIVYQIHS